MNIDNTIFKFGKALVWVDDPSTTVDLNGKLVFSQDSSNLFVFVTTEPDSEGYGPGSWINAGGSGGGIPVGDSFNLQYNNNGVFGGVLNSIVEPSTGDVTLGAALQVINPTSSSTPLLFKDNSESGAGTYSYSLFGLVQLANDGPLGILLDATAFNFGNSGTGPITGTSKGGISFTDTSENSIGFNELGASSILFGTNLSTLSINDTTGIVADATGGGGGGVGPFSAISAGGASITDSSAAGISIVENGTAVLPSQDASIFIKQNAFGSSIQMNAYGDVQIHSGTAGVGYTPDIELFSNFGILLNDSGSPSESYGVKASSAAAVSLIGPSSSIVVDFGADTTPNIGIGIYGPASTLDVDKTVSGVITASTILNAVGGYQANGVTGISGTGSSISAITVVNGLITAATFAP